MKIWSLGDAVMDLLPLGDMRYEACAGGAPFNVAVGSARLGAETGFIGRVGNDPFGRSLEQTLKNNDVDCQSLWCDEDHRTSTVVVNLAESGERSFTFLVNPSADQFLTADELPVLGRNIIHFCSLALVGESSRWCVNEAVRQIKQQGGWVSFDINLREQMWADKHVMRQAINEQCTQADILKLSDEELFWLVKSESMDWNIALKQLDNYPAQLKVVTRGKEGCIMLYAGKAYFFASYQVNCIDTTGAGDAYVAGMLTYLSRNGIPENDDLGSFVSFASACGALATTQKGALSALPSSAMVTKFIAQQGRLDVNNQIDF